MNKFKRIICLASVVFLVALYLVTLFSAIFLNQGFKPLFMASVYCTIFIPITLYAMMLIYKLINKKVNPEDQEEKVNK